MKQHELRKRSITGLILGMLIIGATLAGTTSTIILIVAVVAGAAYEYYRIHADMTAKPGFLLPYILCLVPIILYIAQIFPQREILLFQNPLYLIGMVSLATTLVFLSLRKDDLQRTIRQLGSFGLSVLLFTIPGLFAIYLGEWNPRLLLGIFILLWCSDVFAYFGGKAFGKHKLSPGISPAKTWEGFFSGMIATAAASWICSIFQKDLPVIDWIVCAILVVLFGTVGDFLQSAVKRAAGIKDSGNILPGHGGIWDRFDSFLGCIPWIGMYFLIT